MGARNQTVSMSALASEFCGNCAFTQAALHRAADAISCATIGGTPYFNGLSAADFDVLDRFVEFAWSDFALADVARRDTRRDDIEADANGERLILSGEAA
jgi:hypothetical protein